MDYLSTPIEDLAKSLAQAQYEGFENIKYFDRDWDLWHKEKIDKQVTKFRRPDMRDIQVVAMFAQTWGSTALGFGGIGGQAITDAYTIILECNGVYRVYFGGRFAYSISKPNANFFEDMRQHKMEAVKEAFALYEKTS